MRYLSVIGLASAAAVLAAGGCGSEQRAQPTPAAPASAAASASSPVSVSSHPSVAPRAVVLHDQLFSVERRWPGIAIADRLAIDSHGRGRIVRGGGGGGLRIENCRFTADEMAGWRHDLRLLGPKAPAGVSPEPRPATYLINYRSLQRVVQTGAMPKRYLPLTRRITRLLYRGGKGCSTTFAQHLHSHSAVPG